MRAAILLCLSLLGSMGAVQAQDKEDRQIIVNPEFASLTDDSMFSLLDPPQVLWSTQVGAILDDNGVYISPDGSLLVSTSEDGTLYALNPDTGDILWVYEPTIENTVSVRCFSGVTFSYDGPTKYLVYSIVEDPNSQEPNTRVIGLSPAGEELWTSLGLEGVGAGTPLASWDGRHIYLTHNSNQLTVGHFTVLDTQALEQGVALAIYSEFNRTNPFSPPGIYHQPEEGYYDGGEWNNNDILIWSFAPRPTDMTVGLGMAFVFQFPREFNNDMNTELYWYLLGDDTKDWQSISAPIMTNKGRSLYWGVSRSQYRAWVGEPGRNQYRFSRSRTSSVNFDRGFPRNQATFNTPALSSDPVAPKVYGGTASNQFVKMDSLLNTEALVNTTGVVKAQAKVTPNDQYVYYTEFEGILHMANTDSLEDYTKVANFGYLDGDFAMHPTGGTVYVGEISGTITAIKFANVPTLPPTRPPTSAPIATPVPETDEPDVPDVVDTSSIPIDDPSDTVVPPEADVTSNQGADANQPPPTVTYETPEVPQTPEVDITAVPEQATQPPQQPQFPSTFSPEPPRDTNSYESSSFSSCVNVFVSATMMTIFSSFLLL